MRRSRCVWALMATGAVIAWVAMTGAGHSGGAPETAATDGCTCHAPVANPATTLSFTGLPSQGYTAGESYELTVSGTGLPAIPVAGQNQGGFAVKVDPVVGTFESDDGNAASPTPGFITHTSEGNDQRSWTFRWVVPQDAAGDVTFHVAVNLVNGNGFSDPEDGWQQADFTASFAGVANGTAEPTPTTTSLAMPGFGFWATMAAATGLAFVRRRA